MFKLFTERLRGAAVAVLACAPGVIFLLGFEATGLRVRLGEAEAGRPGEPYWIEGLQGFTPEQARAALTNIHMAGAEGVAYAVHAIDAVFMVSAFLALGAVIGFGLRQLGWANGAWRYLLLAPAIFLIADVVETGGLALALAFRLEEADGFLQLAGWATAVKWPAAAVSTGLALIALAAGGVALALRRPDKALGPQL